MNLRLLFPAASAALLLLPPSLCAQEKVSLRHRWEAAKVYHYDLNFDADVTGNPGGNQTTTLILQVDVTVRQEAGTGIRHAEVKATSVKAMIDKAGDLKTFDSDNPALSDPTLQEGMGRLLGQTVILVYDGDDTFKEAVLPEGSTLGSPDGRNGPTGQVIGEFFREIVTGALPTDPVALKEEFSQERHVQLAPEATAIRTQKGRLDSISQNRPQPQATILAEGTMEIAPTDPGNVRIGPLPKLDFKAETVFDLQQKAVQRATTQLDMKVPGPQGAEVSMKATATAVLKGITDAPPSAAAEKK